jgi:tRNA nucleotidyltransferase (CCA-adding enzyme)
MERVQSRTETELFDRVRTLTPVAAILEEAAELGGGGVYLVGGALRDVVVGRQFLDIDLAVDGDALKLACAIGVPEGTESRFGTLRVARDGVRYDLARTRAERYSHPGALPEVEPARIDDDLGRRDFTVNALALGLTGPRAGELIIADNALEDLAARRLAVLHDHSFEDDPTRLLRLARYAARLGFTIAPHTRTLADQAIRNGALDTVSGTRIGNELRLLASEPDPVAAFQMVTALGLPWSLDADLARAALAALPPDGRRDLLALSCVFTAAFAAQPSKQLVSELDRLGFTAPDRDAIVEGAVGAPALAKRLANTTSNAEIARTVGTAGIETVALASAQGATSQSLTWLRDLRHLDLDITGEDLIRNGIPQGPEIGRALQAARDALMNGLVTDRDSQLRVALKAAE